MPVAIKSSEAKRQELRVLDEAIAERQKYFRDQEKQIADLEDSGNGRLKELHCDILMAEKLLKDIKTDIRSFRRDKQLIEEDLEVMRVEIAQYELPGLSLTAVSVTG